MTIKRFFIGLCAASLGACAAIIPTKRVGLANETELPPPSLEKIADGVWIHESYEEILPWGPVLSQGLVVKNDVAVYLIDTAWNDKDTERLLDLVADETGALPILAIVTHAHQDKMGGVGALNKRGVATIAHAYANEDAPTRDLTPARQSLRLETGTTAVITDWSAEIDKDAGSPKPMVTVFYPGPAHDRGNVVTYTEIGGAKILFGGCLIRPAGTKNLGNTADGDVANWADAVRLVAAEFPEAEIVVPSHGAPGGRELFDHTIALAEAANE